MSGLKIIRSQLFQNYPEIIFGFSTKAGGISPSPLELNLSLSVGDNPDNVKQNRKLFFDELGISENEVTFQKQIHSTTVCYSSHPRHLNDCDAIYTDKKNNFLSVGVADCIPIFLFEPEKKVVAAIHSGWKGTIGEILTATISELTSKFMIDTRKLICYIGPGISQMNYEVGEDLAKTFDKKYVHSENGKYFLDLKKHNTEQLIRAGIKSENIEVSELCTYDEKNHLHSFRRDGVKSGRMMGIIGIVERL